VFPTDGGWARLSIPAGAAAFVVRRHNRDAMACRCRQIGQAHDLGGADAVASGMPRPAKDQFDWFDESP